MILAQRYSIQPFARASRKLSILYYGVLEAPLRPEFTHTFGYGVPLGELVNMMFVCTGISQVIHRLQMVKYSEIRSNRLN